MKWYALAVRVAIAFLAALLASRQTGAPWEPALLGASVAALTTLEAGMQQPPARQGA